jgi:hypothetical protein
MKRGEWPTLDFVLTNAPDGIAMRIDAITAEYERRGKCLDDTTLELRDARARLAEAESLITCLIDNHPDDHAADAVLVYEVWLKDAMSFMGRTADSASGVKP